MDDLTKYESIVELTKFREHPWEFQSTFETPLKNLDLFVKTILTSIPSPQSATFIIDSVVFEPRNLIRLLAGHSLPDGFERGTCLMTAGFTETENLLRVSLSDWIDFLFLPDPPTIAIYADHDEFMTLYGHEHSTLDGVVAALLEQGFKLQRDYRRHF